MAGCVQEVLDASQELDGVRGDVAALGEVLAQKSVGVLARAPLLGSARVGEVDAVGEELCDLIMSGHLRAWFEASVCRSCGGMHAKATCRASRTRWLSRPSGRGTSRTRR